MNDKIALAAQAQAWLTDSALNAHAQSYSRYLIERGYSLSSVKAYLCGVAHFAHWLKKRRVKVSQLDEAVVRRFLDDHLSRCDCPVRIQRCRHPVRAALKHMLIVLRLNGDIPLQSDSTPCSIQEEIKRFESHLNEVCGVAASTRARRASVVRTFLLERFRASPIDIAQVKPQDIYRFVIRHLAGCKPSTGKVLGGALRSYLRFRGMHGDNVQALIASVPKIAQWQLASLPDVLSDADLELFLNAFDRRCATGRRDYAMARCLIDLGLRASEVAQLQLDDLNWRDGTLRLSTGKTRQARMLPLPTPTGRAIAEYLADGRPISASRAIFLRHVAPLTEPIGASVVRIAVRCAYARCGWAQRWTGTHVLRHSVASRLLQAGTPMKEIADILGHHCLDTTAIYAKVDFSKLAAIALPWLGSES